jgi:hypothetical protein
MASGSSWERGLIVPEGPQTRVWRNSRLGPDLVRPLEALATLCPGWRIVDGIVRRLCDQPSVVLIQIAQFFIATNE